MSSNDDTSPGPPPDSDHPPKEDTLLERGAEDALDEGYSPPDREPGPHWGETPYEQVVGEPMAEELAEEEPEPEEQQDRKSTRLNSSHVSISYAVFCLKKKKNSHQVHPRSREGNTLRRRPRLRKLGSLTGAALI